ncbi:MAG: GNAT family N-acetyltransferase [Acutalibacteraceae bacterium]
MIDINIRKYEQRDKEKVRNICLENANVSPDDKDVARFILLMFCDYYIEQEPENCFVATDENDEAVGYVYGTLNYDKYHQIFMEHYYPKIKKISLRRACEARVEMHDHAKYKKDYPAHFHIDVLPAYQSAGIGSKLLPKLCDIFRENGASGVMLICGKDNIGAQRFYKKNGFDVLHTKMTGVAMGKSLNKSE